MKVSIVNFDKVYPIWKDELWADRKTEITASSPIDFMGKYNTDILQNAPICFACYDADEIIGVNTLLQTSMTHCRSRGIYVKSEQRLKGVGHLLMKETLKYAKYLCFEYIWSMPRESALSFYLKFGFKQVSEFDDQYEFGPNCFILRKL